MRFRLRFSRLIRLCDRRAFRPLCGRDFVLALSRGQFQHGPPPAQLALPPACTTRTATIATPTAHTNTNAAVSFMPQSHPQQASSKQPSPPFPLSKTAHGKPARSASKRAASALFPPTNRLSRPCLLPAGQISLHQMLISFAFGIRHFRERRFHASAHIVIRDLMAFWMRSLTYAAQPACAAFR